jgi:hypothetical protein
MLTPDAVRHDEMHQLPSSLDFARVGIRMRSAVQYMNDEQQHGAKAAPSVGRLSKTHGAASGAKGVGGLLVCFA